MIREALILVAEDDAAQRRQLAGFLTDLGARVVEAEDGEQALAAAARSSPDLVLTDLRMPGLDGSRLLSRLQEVDPELPVIVVTAYGTVEGAVECLRAGAVDFLLKPLDLDAVEHCVARTLETRQLRRENLELRRRLGAVESIPGIVTSGAGSMSEVLSLIERVSRSDVSVLLLGESGTGKELLARAVHGAGARRERPFVAVNASALSSTLLESELFGHERGAFTGAERARAGRFEAARGGSLFLDEIGDLPAEVQVKLLRTLQERSVERVGSNRSIPIDVRIIAATHRDLPALIRDGSFREDLYYRLAVVTIEIPPLRRRRADIPLLVEHFLEKHLQHGTRQIEFSREAMDLIMRYDYPGNVRELENIVQRCLVLARGDQITVADLPPSVAGAERTVDRGVAAGGTLPEQIAALERVAIETALAEEGGNQTRAAQRLGISERALRYKLAKLRSND